MKNLIKKLRIPTKSEIHLIYEEDILRANIGICGCMSAYKGVLVFWDEDQDSRIIEFLDLLMPDEVKQLAAAHEHQGSLYLIWCNEIPEQYEERKSIDVAGDNWDIVKSIVLE